MNFYTADPHLGHENIIRLSQRPFKSVEEMNETIIKNINNVVGTNDDLYILGDFAYKCKDPIKYLSRLRGRKHLIIGNHDDALLANPLTERMFVDIKHYDKINDNGRQVVLCHYPIAEWDGYFKGVYHLYGHVHNNFGNPWYKIMGSLKNCYNVGVDVCDYKPVTLDELIKNH